MSGHTPAPWRYWLNDRKTMFVVQSDQGGTMLADCNTGHPPNFPTLATAEANARLIAAAPDLLDVLKAICEELEDDDSLSARQIAMHGGRAAIAKAEGDNQ